jgi:outer membrane protein assembly factor BamA
MRRVIDCGIVNSLLLWFVVCPSGLAQTQDQSSDGRKILVDSFVIAGTRAIDSAELAEITGSIAGSEFNDDPDELGERVRSQFQDHGYFQAVLEKLEIKVIDPLASPKPVRLEAEVSEGPLCRLSGIDFTGNHSVASKELRALFPIKTGDVFKKAKIAEGLESMMRSAGSHGLLDFVAVPSTTFGPGSTVKLDIEVQEGPQYRMGKLEIIGPPEVAEKLQEGWELDSGAIYDSGYMKTFLGKNSSLLPADFVESSGAARFKDCGNATVSVHFHLVPDAQHEALDRAMAAKCGH